MADWKEVVGGNLMAIKGVLGTLQANLAGVVDQPTAQYFLSNARQFVTALESGIKDKLDIAAKAGLQPTRFIGISQLAIAAAATPQIAVNTNEDARIIGFRVDATWAVDFRIVQILISNKALVLGAAAMPATAFVTGVSIPPTDSPLMKAGAGAVVTVFNRAAVARDFDAVFFGIPTSEAGSPCPC